MIRAFVFIVCLFWVSFLYATTDIDVLIEKAEAGDAKAQFQLVKIYGQGIGVEKSPSKAKYWFYKSTENGYAEAQYWTGYNYYHGQGNVNRDIGKALQWYEKSAKQGYAEAQFMVGYIYQMGYLIGGKIDKDINKSVHWYKQAVLNKSMGAQFHLGCFMYFGIGINQNINAAESLIQNAASKGNKGAQHFLEIKDQANDEELQKTCDIYPNAHS